MPPGPRAPAWILTSEEPVELERLVRRAHGSQALATRARIVLACAEPGATNSSVARELGVCRPSIIEWRGRFAAQRLAGLSDAPRSGAPRTVQDEDVERLLVLTLETQPKNTTHGSTRSMAARAGMSQTMVKAGVARLRFAASSAGNLQALFGSGFRGQGARCCWPVFAPAGSCVGALR
jgi:transposase-like protein